MKNKDVKRAFLERRPAETKNLISTGEKLLSYGWYEIARWVGAEIVIRNGRAYSPTTSKHRSGLRGLVARNPTDKHQGGMNI